METGPDGKSQRQYYYYINYKKFVNLIKYKLDFMRRKIETEERESTSRALFKCQGCAKCYTDLEADHLFDPKAGEFRCHHCGEAVEEAEGERSSETPQQLLVRFNEQIEPLFVLLGKVENIKLAPDLLEPEPKELEVRIPGQPKAKSSAQQSGNPGGWSGDATRYAAVSSLSLLRTLFKFSEASPNAIDALGEALIFAIRFESDVVSTLRVHSSRRQSPLEKQLLRPCGKRRKFHSGSRNPLSLSMSRAPIFCKTNPQIRSQFIRPRPCPHRSVSKILILSSLI